MEYNLYTIKKSEQNSELTTTNKGGGESMKHEFYKSEDVKHLDNRNSLYLNVVDGGLDICKVCNQYEGGLTAECVGRPTSNVFGDYSYSRRLEVKNGIVFIEKDLFNKYLSMAKASGSVPLSETETLLFEELFALNMEIGLLEVRN